MSTSPAATGMAGTEGMTEALFSVGERVKVARAFPPGHRRVPTYIRGRIGVVAHHTGAFPNPEEKAYGLDAACVHFYRVAFKQREIWNRYDGPEHDELFIEIQETWLHPAEEAST